jgi:hypothetical protein
MSHDYPAAFTSGHRYNVLVGQYLEQMGVPCEVPPLRLAKTVEERAEFTRTEKDIVLPDGRVLEVKGVSPKFDWDPASYKAGGSIIVDTESGYRGKDQKPFAYIFVSRVTEAMLCIDTKTERDWETIVAGDRFRGLKAEHFLIAPVRLLRPMSALLAALKRKPVSRGD